MNKYFFLLLKVTLGAILIATLVYLDTSSRTPALRAFQSPLFQSPLPVPLPTIAPTFLILSEPCYLLPNARECRKGNWYWPMLRLLNSP
ncbi:MAG: hypothetical protein N2508_15785 [Anaerolineae bacterium]|nr:hypothetical protein [Anaerolineae bacterium]